MIEYIGSNETKTVEERGVAILAALLVVAAGITPVAGIGRGKPVFLYNLLDVKRTVWAGPALGSGKHTIVFDFKSAGPDLGKGGTGVLSVDGKEVARASMENSIPITFPEDESFDIGRDTRTGVSMFEHRYDSPFPFTGSIDKLTFDLAPQQVTAEARSPRPDIAGVAARAKDELEAR